MEKKFQKNIDELKKYHPYFIDYLNREDEENFKVEFKEGYLKINNLTCFSKYNPQKEAERLIENWEKEQKQKTNKVLVFGVSNPYLIKNLTKKYNVSIFIPNISIFKKILKFYDFSDIFKKIEKLMTIDNLEFNNLNYNIFPLKIELKLFSEILNKIYSGGKSFLKVIFVNPIYGGSLPIAKYIEKNLKKFNVKLKVINSEVFYSAMKFIKENFSLKRNESKSLEGLINLISDIILNTIEEFKPDILFGIAQSPINFKVLEYCKNKGILKLFWFMEDYKLFTYWKQFASFYDFYFTIQKDTFFKELKNIGVKNYYYLPVAAEPSVHKPLKLSIEEKKYYGSTLSFVGAGYYNRRIFFRNLVDYDFKIWGSDWDGEVILSDKIQERGRRVSPEEYVKIFNASLININLHSSTFYPGVDPNGDFVNPRTFEIAATNSIQLVDRRKYLPELFIENEEILVFSNFREFKDLVDKIIKSPEKYLQIAEKGYKRVLKDHTYEQRLKEIFEKIGFNLDKLNIEKESPDFYFFKFNSIDEIADYINSKDKINDTDKIFLLMKSLRDTYLK